MAPGGGGLLAVIERLATNPAAQHRGVRPAARCAAPGGGPRRRARLQRRDERGQGRDPAGPQNARCRLPVEAGGRRAHQVPLRGLRRCRARRRPGVLQHGLSYRFRISQKGDQVTVTCIVSHADGYSEETSPLESKVDPGSTGMSMVQALGSALTYLQRYSLRAAIGLAAGVDDDGKGAGGTSPRIVDEQARRAAPAVRRDGPQRGHDAQSHRRRRDREP